MSLENYRYSVETMMTSVSTLYPTEAAKILDKPICLEMLVSFFYIGKDTTSAAIQIIDENDKSTGK